MKFLFQGECNIIYNSRTSLISILLLYKYSSYDYRVIFSCQTVYTPYWATLYFVSCACFMSDIFCVLCMFYVRYILCLVHVLCPINILCRMHVLCCYRWVILVRNQVRYMLGGETGKITFGRIKYN